MGAPRAQAATRLKIHWRHSGKRIEMGADGVELDVQLTKDGELVVIHDETVDRTSDGSGWVKDFTYARISRFNYNRTHKEGYERAMIPTLEEVYDLLKPTDLRSMWN